VAFHGFLFFSAPAAENEKLAAEFGGGLSARWPAFRLTTCKMMRKAEKMRA